MKDLIQNRLDGYDCETAEDELNALAEITQEVALYALSKSGFFREAVFQGGTALRLLHGLDRFSEDLDFVLDNPNLNFDLSHYLVRVFEVMNTYGYEIEITGEDRVNNNIRKRFIKDNSIKKVISLKHHLDLRKKVSIKIELDVNPPAGGGVRQGFIDFPTSFSIAAHDKSSLFARKCHALLSRNYVKGRDWFDFNWYIANKTPINYTMLENAMKQSGLMKEGDASLDRERLQSMLSEKVLQINWSDAAIDIFKFVRKHDRESLDLWSVEFFENRIEKISQ